MKDKNSIKTGIVLIFIANLINLVISLINGFVLPKYLSVETFANIKTYQLYANYIGVIALGYSDGLYLKYGGKNISDISNKEMNISRGNLLSFQGLMMAILLVASYLIHDKILMITLFSIIPVNIAANLKNIFQATGEFKSYSKIINYTSILTFLGSMILLFFVKSDNSMLYITWSIIVTFFVWILLEVKLVTEYNYKFGIGISIGNLFENIKAGFVLMLGNFSSILMTSIDRWFVKFLLTVQDFAYYSFVVSVEHLINIFITPIVTTMYNYICKVQDLRKIKHIKNICMLVALVLISSAYPVKFILEVYLTKYLPSKNILFILFATEVFYMVIKGIYVNIYKARKEQDIYFKQLVAIIIFGSVLNGLFYMIFHSNEGIAFATLLSVVCWYVVCSLTVKEIAPDGKEIAVLLICIVSFLLTGLLMEAIIGFFIYILVFVSVSYIFMKKEFMEMITMITSTIKNKIS